MDSKGGQGGIPLTSIRDKRPLFIIRRADLWPKQKQPPEFKKILDNELLADYERVKNIDAFQIYERKDLN